MGIFLVAALATVIVFDPMLWQYSLALIVGEIFIDLMLWFLIKSDENL